MTVFDRKLIVTWFALAGVAQILAWIQGWPLLGFGMISLTAGASLLFTVWGIKVLFRPHEPALQKLLKVFVILFFKLVCLGILAITLKRIHDFTAFALLAGSTLFWAVPIIAGLISSKESYARE